ncbi:MAG: DUF2807 domain-containing protein [Flavobacteriales bacterium]|nr:DUF2807 domain-containing protein [Flavobacteriales bacterium]
MSFIRFFFIVVLLSVITSCVNTIDGNGNVVREERTVTSFREIEISGGFEVLLNQGKEEKLELEVDENLLELIQTESKNNKLVIKSGKNIGKAKSLKLYITVVELEDMDVSGAVTLNNKGTFEGDHLSIEISGAADVDLKLDLEELSMDMSGASETTLAGKANHFEIELSGAGELNAEKLKTRNAIIDISGAGSATVHAKKTLNVEVSGAGSVQYKGNPKVTKSISGAGSVKKL